MLPPGETTKAALFRAAFCRLLHSEPILHLIVGVGRGLLWLVFPDTFIAWHI